MLAADVTLALELDPDFRLRGRAGGRDGRRAPTRPTRAARSQQRFFAAVAARRRRPPSRARPRDALGTLAVALACETAIATAQEVRVPRLEAERSG